MVRAARFPPFGQASRMRRLVRPLSAWRVDVGQLRIRWTGGHALVPIAVRTSFLRLGQRCAGGKVDAAVLDNNIVLVGATALAAGFALNPGRAGLPRRRDPRQPDRWNTGWRIKQRPPYVLGAEVSAVSGWSGHGPGLALA